MKRKICKNRGIISRIGAMLLTAAFVAGGVVAYTPAEAIAASPRRNILKEGSDYTAILYDSTNGLPTSEANAIAQTESGFIWIGSYAGLIRYDGTNFYRYDASSGISSVVSLFVDSKQRLWIGTNDSGVSVYDKGEFRAWGKTDGLRSASIRSITEDENGNILIASTQGLAYIDEEMELHLVDDARINGEYIYELKKDTAGNIFGETSKGAVFEVKNLGVAAFYNSSDIGDDVINSIYPDPDNAGIIYMGSEGSEIYVVDINAGGTVQNTLKATGLTAINAVRRINNMIWVCADDGIGYFDENGRFNILSDIPMNNSVDDVLVDHEGNVWFVSSRQGVLKLVPDRFTDISNIAGLDPMVVNSTCISGDSLYVGTDKGLVVLDRNSFSQKENELTRYLDGVRIRCIKKDAEGNLWFCTYGDTALTCYTTVGNIVSYTQEDGLSSNKVRTMEKLSDGSIAVSASGGVSIIKNGIISTTYDNKDGIFNSEILALAQDSEGRLYMGSDGDGIYVVENNVISRLGVENGLTSEVVMRLKFDENGVMWIVTSNSLEYMKDGAITAVDTFPYSNNFDIYFDKYDRAWVLSSNGIYVTRVDELLKNEGIEYTLYDVKSGLPYITTANSRSEIDDEGNLYISGSTGVCMVNIDDDDSNSDSIILTVMSVEADDDILTVENGEEIDIPSGCKRLTIYNYALTYGLNNPRISYYLEGFDDEITYTTKQDMVPATYTNLDGGRYVFHLNVIDDRTGEIQKSLEIPIIKKIAIYETAWFWGIVGFAMIIGTALIMWLYAKKKTEALELKREQDRKFINQIIKTFAKCIDMRDTMNRGHSFRVAYYTKLLAEELAGKRGYTEEQINDFYNIALLHDIGKLSIPDRILNKDKPLDDDEFEIMKTHAEAGEKILKEVEIVPDLAVGAGYHHERIDGKGYPHGNAGYEIPEVARIIAVADTFDAMYSTRPYRKQMELSDVVAEINRIRGTQLEDEVVDAYMKLYEAGKFDKKNVDMNAGTVYDDLGVKDKDKPKESEENN